MRDALHIPRRRRRHHDHGSIQRGRVWVAIIFCIVCCVEAITYLEYTRYFKGMMAASGFYKISSTFKTFIPMLGLAVGVWCRQNWARYLLFAFLVLQLFGALLGWGMMIQDNIPISVWWYTIPMAAAFVVSVWALVSSRDIQRLTNRIYD